jgi:glyoxylase-like metal-dependent hydrolase (beta-lactamase superfamily II)
LIRTSFPVGPLGCNCSIVACAETKEALVVDPGGDAPRILAELSRLGVNAAMIVHTHAHFDHVLGTKEVAAGTMAETALHKDDRWLWDNVEMQLSMFGMSAGGAAPVGSPSRELSGGERLAFGRREARVLHTPGHTPGSICFFVEVPGDEPVLFAGDTLFAGSIGRTDLWGGSATRIMESIHGQILSLPDSTVVIAGHGPETTILAEREENPFLR